MVKFCLLKFFKFKGGLSMKERIRKWLSVILSLAVIVSMFFGMADETLAKRTYVKGYYRKDGTYVKGHYRNYKDTKSGSSSSSTYSPSTSSPSTGTFYYYGNTKVINLYKGNNYWGTANVDELVFVRGYYRKDGTYVRPHFRTHKNNYLTDNFSYYGISTLKPLEKYPSYSFDTNEDIRSIESYLLYNVQDSSLNTIQLNNLKQYALLLGANKDNSEKVKEKGIQFYTSLGYSHDLAEAQAAFDVNPVINTDSYLYQVILAYTKVLNEEQKALLNRYKEKLQLYQQGAIHKLLVEEAGNNFYKTLGLYGSDVKEQVEMDMLQFRATSTDNLDDDFNYYSLSYEKQREMDEKIEQYLMNVTQSYGKNYNFVTALDYLVNLQLLYKYRESYWLEYSRKSGCEYYETLGIDSVKVEDQIQKDLEFVLNLK